jgi:5-methylcytosine-specific restriction endonuclease McrA
MTITEQKRKNNPYQPVGRWIRVEKRLAIYLRDRFTCLYCGFDLHGVGDPRRIQLDHKTPKSQGGGNGERNVFTSCVHCNCSRGAKSFRAYASPGARQRVNARLRTSLKPFLLLAKSILSGQVTRKQALREIGGVE